MKEEKVTDSKLIDTTIILRYLFDGQYLNILEGKDIVFISVLSLFEAKKKMLDKKIPEEIIEEKMDFIKNKSIYLPVSAQIAEKAAKISSNNKIPAIDSIIYLTAIENNLTLFTTDNDFRGMPNAIVFNK